MSLKHLAQFGNRALISRVPNPSFLFALSWGAWALSWIVAAFWSAPAVQRHSTGRRGLAYALICASLLVPLLWQVGGWTTTRWWDVGRTGATMLAGATIPGFAFAWWARLHLGRLWSAAIVIKAGHRIVESGPYGLVRHPIYTGILWAALVTDVAGADIVAAISFLCLLSGFWLKARIEEGFLEQVVSREDYAAYRRSVPMLIPRLMPAPRL